MNKRIVTMFLCMIFLISCNVKEINEGPLPSITASYTENEIVIDGNLSENTWQQTQTIMLRENKTGKPVIDSSNITYVKTLYDRHYLYIAFICKDHDIWGTFTMRDQHLWTEEAVEVFIDTDTVLNTYVEIEVSPKNILFDSYIVDPVNIDIAETKKFDLKNIYTAVSIDGTVNVQNDTDRQWIVEMSIPISELVNGDSQIIPGKSEWKVNFYRIERMRSGESIGYAWSPTGARFHRPEAFGILGFGEVTKNN